MSVRGWSGVALFTAAIAVADGFAAGPAGIELAPSSRAGGRLQAVATLSGVGTHPTGCLTPSTQALRHDLAGATPAMRRALNLLTGDAVLAGERRLSERDIAIRFATDRGSSDRIDLTDENGNGRPDVVDAAIAGITRAQRLLVGGLDLPAPAGVEIVLARLGSGIDGLLLPARDGRVSIWLDPSSRSAATIRRAAEHQYAHGVGTAAGLDSAWSEAFAAWTDAALEDGPDVRGTAAVASRLAALRDGIASDDLVTSSGNSVWFSFLDEAYGRTAVKLAVEELARGGPTDAALDRAVRRATGETFEAAFRDFHLWSLLTGPRDDRRHFSFADRLPAPTFAGSAELLPALSVQADPEISPLGAAAVSLRPIERTGGLAVRFEGDRTARWAVDIVLVRTGGGMHRLSMPLEEDDAGELTVPLQDLREAIVLVRNVDAEGRSARRYSWSAHVEPGYPAEVTNLAVESGGSKGGTIVTWETSSERSVLGFNVLRSRPGDLDEARVNPVWIPAIGEPTASAAYSFVDRTARRGATYQYRIEAITPEGLSSRSDTVVIEAP